MDIKTRPGSKVVVTPNSAHNGYTIHQAQVGHLLLIGQHYTVKRVRVELWSSSVELVEFPEELFNTVNFENVLPSPEELLAQVTTEIDSNGILMDTGDYLRFLGLLDTKIQELRAFNLRKNPYLRTFQSPNP